MNSSVFGSVISAFTIVAGGSLGVVLASGYALNSRALIAAACLGAVSAAKDYRSQMKMPPVSVDAAELPKPVAPKPAGQNDINPS